MLLITGGMGFIGLHTARRFLDAGERVVLTQFRARREPDFIKDALGSTAVVETLDVAEEDSLLPIVERHAVDSVVHLAVPGLGALTPAEEYRTNTRGLLNVLETAREARMRRVTVASSISVYRGLERGPLHEDALLPLTSSNPTEAYKKAEEVLGQHYADRTGIDVVFARIAGIYGPLYHSMANLPSRLAHAAVKGVQPDFTGARGGVPLAEDTNDLCYVKDCARGVQLIHSAPTLRHRVYNVGGGCAVTNAELAEAVNQAVPGANIQLAPGKSPRAVPAFYLDLSRVREEVGYEPEYDVRRGIKDYVTWLRRNAQ